MGRPRSDLGARLRRILVMVPWLLEEGGSTVEDIARRFDVRENDVVRDLNLVMCCGVPPYGGGDLITIVLDDDGTVEAWPGPFFTRPMHLTPAEGFAVLTAGRTLLAVPGAESNGPLASALDKLERALGTSGALAVDLEAPPLLDEVRQAVDRCERLRVAYYSAWRDELTSRVVDPLLVHAHEGRWYVEVLDVGAGEPRRLRVDRLRSLEPTGETFDRPADVAPPEDVFSPSTDMTEVILRLPPSARWVTEAYEVEVLDPAPGDDGRLRVRLFVAGERFLERLLLKAGAEASVESPASMQSVGCDAAHRVLARYR